MNKSVESVLKKKSIAQMELVLCWGMDDSIRAKLFDLKMMLVQHQNIVGYLFIYLFTSLTKRPRKLTEQAPLRGPEKKE